MQKICDKCGRSLDVRGLNRHHQTCTGKTYVPKFKTKPRKKKVKNYKTEQGISTPLTSPQSIEGASGVSSVLPTFKSNILKEINMKGEFDKMSETINPKKEKKDEEPKYECGACHYKFNEKVKFCASCGTEFE